MLKRSIAISVLLVCQLVFSPLQSRGAGFVRLVLWEQGSSEQDAALDALIAEFQKKNPYIVVRRVDVGPAEFSQKFLDAASCGAGPDILLGPGSLLPSLVPDKTVAPLPELMGQDFLEGFDPVAVSGSTYNGTVYMLPDRCAGALSLIYNRKMIRSAPAGWDELVEAGAKLRKDRGTECAVALCMDDPLFTLPFLTTFGGAPLDRFDYPGARPTLDTPAVRGWCAFLKTMKDANVFPQSASRDEARRLFAEGKTPFLIDDLRSFRSSAAAARVDIGAAALPKRGGAGPAPLLSMTGYFVSSAAAGSSAKREAARLFLEFMTGKDAQRRMSASHGMLPSLLSARKEVRAVSAAALPVVLQMKPVLESIGSVQRDIFAGKVKPEDAPALMQKKAVEGMRTRGMLVTDLEVRPFGGDD